jgi:hypothetical protein
MTVANLTPAIQRFIELERKKTDIKRYFEELNEALEAVVAEVGVGTYFQDPSDGTVFKLLVPEGKFVHFERFSYHRTKRGDEKRGDLSMKEAQEAGFTLA